MQLSFKTAYAPVRPASRRGGPVVCKALFGFGKRDDSDKEEQFRLQQELLAKRKTGEAIKVGGLEQHEIGSSHEI
jgi:hypothetical protein